MIRSSRPILPEEVADHYDDLDRIYREVWGEHVHHGLWRTGGSPRPKRWSNSSNSSPQKRAFAPGCSAVDIGCGYGATARQLAARYGARITGLDDHSGTIPLRGRCHAK